MKNKRSIFANIDTSDLIDNGIRNIYYKEIKPSPDNKFGIRNIEELAENIRENGLDHNLVLREIDDADFHYEIIAGERRFTAITRNIESGDGTYEYIPCKVIRADDRTARRKLILNNLQARVTNTIEMLESIAELEEYHSQAKAAGEAPAGRIRDLIAKDVCLKPTQVGTYQKINHDAISEVFDLLSDEKITLNTAYLLAGLASDEQRELITMGYELTPTSIERYKQSKLSSEMDIEDDIEDEWRIAEAPTLFSDEEETMDKDVSVTDTQESTVEKWEDAEDYVNVHEWQNIEELPMDDAPASTVETMEMNQSEQHTPNEKPRTICELIQQIDEDMQMLMKKINRIEFKEERPYLETTYEDFVRLKDVLKIEEWINR